eukprot:scaffold27431_cov140-Isochrysis_galbana.AAC.2
MADPHVLSAATVHLASDLHSTAHHCERIGQCLCNGARRASRKEPLRARQRRQRITRLAPFPSM